MTTNDELEARLRDDLLANEVAVAPRADLAAEAIAGGRRTRRRRRLAGGAIGVLTVCSVVLGSLALQDRSPDAPAPEPPANSKTPAPDVNATGSPIDWATALPRGVPPEVPYLVGVDLHLPGGQVVDLQGSGAEVIGASAVGTVLLVETADAKGFPFSTRYVVVSDDGEVQDLPINTLTPVQEAAVSPDGTLFAAHRAVVRLDDLSPVAAIPDHAELLIAWTASGIVYSTHGNAYFLWQPGSQQPPTRLAGHPGVFLNGTDIGLRQRDGCSQVTVLEPDGTITPGYEICDGSPLHTVSPGGQWAITRDLRVVDLRTGVVAPLDGASVGRMHVSADSRWLSEDEVLLTITPPETAAPITRALLVRCRLAESACERATETLDVPLTQGNIGLP